MSDVNRPCLLLAFSTPLATGIHTSNAHARQQDSRNTRNIIPHGAKWVDLATRIGE